MRFFALVDGHAPGGFLRLTDDLDVELLTKDGAWRPAPAGLCADVLAGEAQEVPVDAPALRAYAVKAWRSLLEAMEEKVTRVVRTPEGAKKYGQPIGSVIIADSLDEMYALLDAAEAKKVKKRKAAIKFYAQRRDGLSATAAQAKADEYELQALEDVLKDDALEAGLIEPWEAVPGEQLDVAYPKDEHQYFDGYTDEQLNQALEDVNAEYRALEKEQTKLDPDDELNEPPEEDDSFDNRYEEIVARLVYLTEAVYAIEHRQKARAKARRVLRAGPEPDRPPVGTVGTYQGQAVEVLELGGGDIDWLLRVRLGDSDYVWLEPGELAPPVKPTTVKAPVLKKGELHPHSGRPDPYADPLTRGGDGPLYGYSAGDLVWDWNYGDRPQLYRVTDEPFVSKNELNGKAMYEATERRWVGGADGQGRETHDLRTTHSIRAVRLDPDTLEVFTDVPTQTPSLARWLEVEDIIPADMSFDQPRNDPGYRVTPSLNAVGEASFPLETLLPADGLDAMKRVLKRKAVALDSASDSYEGHLTPDLLALRHAKADALRALGVAFGWTPEETDAAADRLAGLLEGWRMVGGIFPGRLEMHRAVKRLRAGEVADDVDTRAMLLQRAWSHATWDAKYGRDASVPVSRFVQSSHAATLAAVDLLTKPLRVPNEEADYRGATREVPAVLDPEDVRIKSWTLTSWTMTPGGVKSGWIGRDSDAVELKTTVTRDQTWLNVWSEERFRTRGLKAPGEFIIDDTKALDLANVEVVVYEETGGKWSTGPGEQARVAAAFASHVMRHPDSNVEAASAGLELLVTGRMRAPFFPDNVVKRIARDEEGSGYRRSSEVPGAPELGPAYFDKETGERYVSTDRYRPDPDWDDRDKYERRLVVLHDAEREALLDTAAGVASERGWSQSSIENYRMAVERWSMELADLVAYGHQRFPVHYTDFGEKAKTDPQGAYEDRHRSALESEARYRALMRDAARRLGLELSDAALEAEIERFWHGNNAFGEKFQDAMKVVPWA